MAFTDSWVNVDAGYWAAGGTPVRLKDFGYKIIEEANGDYEYEANLIRELIFGSKFEEMYEKNYGLW